jgi:hypothetical protein
MHSLRPTQSSIVVVLIACLLRALLPVDGVLSDLPSGPSGSESTLESPDYPCAGHQCGCRTAEHCLAACCCFPMRRMQTPATTPDSSGEMRAADVSGSNRATASASRLSPSVQLSPLADVAVRGQPTAFIQSLKCAGGGPHPFASATSIVSIEPQTVAWSSIDDSTCAGAHVVFERVASVRPSPSTPPPRVRASSS